MLADDILDTLARTELVVIADGRVRLAEPWLARWGAGQPASGEVPIPAGEWGSKVIVGLTGNIATGKSTVLNMLGELGAYVINADRLVHRLREPGAPGYRALVDLLGPAILLPDGRIDREGLSRRAFDDPSLLRSLEAIFRPLVVAEVERLGRAAVEPVIVVEAIRLLEGGLSHQVDVIWVVDAPRQIRIARLVTERGLSHEEAGARVNAQNPQSEKVARADVVIANAGDLTETYRQVLAGWRDILHRLYAAGWLKSDLVARTLQQTARRAGWSLDGRLAQQALRTLAVNLPENGLNYAEALALLKGWTT